MSSPWKIPCTRFAIRLTFFSREVTTCSHHEVSVLHLKDHLGKRYGDAYNIFWYVVYLAKGSYENTCEFLEIFSSRTSLLSRGFWSPSLGFCSCLTLSPKRQVVHPRTSKNFKKLSSSCSFPYKFSLITTIFCHLTLLQVWSERYFSPSRRARAISQAHGKVYNLFIFVILFFMLEASCWYHNVHNWIFSRVRYIPDWWQGPKYQ